MIRRFGGVFFSHDNNLANPGSLDHVLEAIEGSLFGQELYPTLFEKGAAIAWRIIKGHVFHDGNKRTGMEACRNFFDLNGYILKMDNQTIDVAVDIASNKMEFPDFVAWIEGRIESKP
jgi:death-on-curing protein